MVAVTLSKSLPRDADAVIVGFAEVSGEPALVDLPEPVGKGFKKAVGTTALQVALDLGATAKVGSATVLPSIDGTRIVVVGIGAVDVTAEQVRRAVGNGVRALAALEPKTPVKLAIALDLAEPALLKAAAEGALLGGYSFTKIGGKPTDVLASVTLMSSAKDGKDVAHTAEVISAAVNQARDWVNMPGNLLYPETFAADAAAMARRQKLTIDVLDEKDLAKQGYGGILAVGGGSARTPRLVRISYAPRGARAHLVLVGKGITFDTGGINLKPGDSMTTMKCDMAGAAAVLAATSAIAELGLKIRVTAYAPMAENMPSSSAYKPSDVLTMYGGKTVENYNSDAEGRIVMADALARGMEDKPDVIVDVATLTGACMVALGEKTAGLMASDDATADLLLDAAEVAGEAFWQLPITDEAADQLTSKVADIRSGGSRMGGALSAAAFLRSFVSEDVAWAHLDIAGPAFNDQGAYDYVPTGGTGMAVRTLVALAQSLQG